MLCLRGVHSLEASCTPNYHLHANTGYMGVLYGLANHLYDQSLRFTLCGLRLRGVLKCGGFEKELIDLIV